MSEENKTNIEELSEQTNPITVAPESEPVEIKEVIPSMDEFKDEIARSFKKITEGDILTGTVIGISESEVILDLGYYTEGIIKLEELSNDPAFSIKADVTLGEELSGTVLREDDGHGNILHLTLLFLLSFNNFGHF